MSLARDATDQPGAQPLRFRRLRGDDLPRVVEIENAAFSHPWSMELLRKEMTNEWSTVLLATERRNGEEGEREAILGFVVFWLVHDELHILNVAVAREERRRGIGRELMLEAHRRGRQLGAVLATLEVRRSNQAAIELYRNLGYRLTGVRKNYYVDEGEDAFLMLAEL